MTKRQLEILKTLLEREIDDHKDDENFDEKYQAELEKTMRELCKKK